MATAMDSAIGQVIEALKESDMYNDTIIVFTGDNGGQIFSGGNNYPLRGNKGPCLYDVRLLFGFLPLSTSPTDFHYKIHATLLTSSTFWGPPTTVDVI